MENKTHRTEIWHIGSIHAGRPADLAEILSPLSPAGNMPSFAAAGSIRCFPASATPSPIADDPGQPAGRPAYCFKPQLAEEEDEEGRGGEEG
uniref:Uncharacterized protein n=1 Tax=Oryza rufipogon TaxID=4529 RepID=A0A0E0MT69_ORYRU